MPNHVVEVSHLYKKFRRGTLHDSLRDLIPSIVGRLLNRSPKEALRSNEFWALSDLSFSVEAGEAFGVIGNNGAGKSTILKLLTGLLKPSAGDIHIKGRVSALIEVGAGFHPDLTGRENIFLNGTILGMTRSEIRKKFDEIVDFSGLSEFIDTPVKRYSSGMYARLGFSVCAHVDPNILVVDEVLSVGDLAFQKKCLDKMNAVIRGGATVLFVSHNLRAVTDLCHRAILIDKGKVVLEGSAHEVVSGYLSAAIQRTDCREEKDVVIRSVRITKDAREGIRFETGEKVTVEIEIEAKKTTRRFSVEVYVKDDKFYDIFHTSSERLSGTRFLLEQGQFVFCNCELTLNLAPGTYHIGVMLYRSEIQKDLDRLYPASTIYIHSRIDVGGSVNMFPSFSFRTDGSTCIESPVHTDSHMHVRPR